MVRESGIFPPFSGFTVQGRPRRFFGCLIADFGWPILPGWREPVRQLLDLLRRWRVALLLFVGSAVVLALFSWGNVLQPSRHFHFLDLANSFLQGRVDTESPKRFKGQQSRPDDPHGLQAAVDRHLTEPSGKVVGWNDWASLRIITLTDGTVVKGVFPWSDQQGDQKNKFLGLDGEMRIIDPELDIAKTCGDPPRRCDETRYFMSFPPFPAVAMMPAFLIWGYDVNDVLFSILNAALNAVLILLLLETLRTRGLSARTTRENVLLAILFTFGTVNLFSSIRGEVWFSALIVGVTLHVAYILLSIEARYPFFAGLMLGLGMATRTPIAFAAPFFALEMLRDGDRMRWPGWGTFLRKGVMFSIPIVAIGMVLMAYNYARFESVGEFGHSFLANGTRASLRDHGLFSWWFLKANLAAAFTNPPVIDSFPPFVHITRHGLGLPWTTPALLLILWPKTFGAFARNLALTAAIVAIPDLFYQNTGWAQFGYRFGLDFMPYLLVMLAVGGRKFGRGFMVLFALSLLMCALGAITFDRIGMFYYE